MLFAILEEGSVGATLPASASTVPRAPEVLKLALLLVAILERGCARPERPPRLDHAVRIQFRHLARHRRLEMRSYVIQRAGRVLRPRCSGRQPMPVPVPLASGGCQLEGGNQSVAKRPKPFWFRPVSAPGAIYAALAPKVY